MLLSNYGIISSICNFDMTFICFVIINTVSYSLCFCFYCLDQQASIMSLLEFSSKVTRR